MRVRTLFVICLLVILGGLGYFITIGVLQR